jgi:hypothetical protein
VDVSARNAVGEAVIDIIESYDFDGASAIVNVVQRRVQSAAERGPAAWKIHEACMLWVPRPPYQQLCVCVLLLLLLGWGGGSVLGNGVVVPRKSSVCVPRAPVLTTASPGPPWCRDLWFPLCRILGKAARPLLVFLEQSRKGMGKKKGATPLAFDTSSYFQYLVGAIAGAQSAGAKHPRPAA